MSSLSEYCQSTNLGQEVRDSTFCHMGGLYWHAELFSAHKRRVHSCERLGSRGHPLGVSFRTTHGSNKGQMAFEALAASGRALAVCGSGR